ncbi:hypothetical protein WT81_32415 [Burkholderia stagnalis]|uniref:DUF1330 domain-containing protein n=1 Tax=Burkholderia stagnalis TaxID=1503054 RepID=UPI00075FD3C8|nr:DUF1330 domain-containing protein [Burkholderia stagnalis]KWK42829.1 hypothetical protein WT80_23875 [Burkholderia stagnalis]KWK48188.1 hypothetical protein WT81_32415 [Burkholderia stagnalis]
MANGEVLVVIEVRAVSDPEKLKAYQIGAREQIGPRGGVVIARGGSTIEGDPLSGPLMVQRWPSEASFRGWQESEEYRPLREMRQSAADVRIVVVPMM